MRPNKPNTTRNEIMGHNQEEDSCGGISLDDSGFFIKSHSNSPAMGRATTPAMMKNSA